MRLRVMFAAMALATCLFGAGCVELDRRQVSMKISVEDPWQIGHAGLAISPLRRHGLSGDRPVEGRHYRVSKTDTIVLIAQRYYGNRNRAADIYAANETLLERSGGLKRGMIIVLPAAKAEDISQAVSARP